MRRVLFCILAVGLLPLAPAYAAGQLNAQMIFNGGQKVQYRVREQDRRFDRSDIAKALDTGTDDPACAQVLTGLLAALANAGPLLQSRDARFILDPNPIMVAALQRQLMSRRFPGNAYLAAMVRRVMIDGKLPDKWFATAKKLDPRGEIIDLSRLKFLAQGFTPIDSIYFSFPVLLQRYQAEVKSATTAASGTAMQRFRDTYLDHTVAWGGLTVVDIRPEEHHGHDSEGGMVARLELRPAPKHQTTVAIPFLRRKRGPKPYHFTVHLQPYQLVTLSDLGKGQKVLVRGRLFDFNSRMTHFVIRDALLFPEPSPPIRLADPRAVAKCSIATDELNGVDQAGTGFAP